MLERRDAVLLALLALKGPTLRSRAALLLWPDLDGKAARSNLRQRLCRLHRISAQPLLSADATLRIAGTAAVDLHRARALLAASPDACTGELLGSHDYSDSDTLDAWVQTAREKWRRDRLDALAAEASRHEAAMQIADAAGTVFDSVDGISTLYTHTVVKRRDGTVWAWGPNRSRQLGDTPNVNRRNPVPAPANMP